MLMDIQSVVHSPEGVPVLVTDMVSSDRRRVGNRVRELTKRKQQCRVVPQYGPYLSAEEIQELR